MRFICLIFFLAIYLNCGTCYAQATDNAKDIKKELAADAKADSIEKNLTIIKKIAHAFKFRANYKKAQEKRILKVLTDLNALKPHKDSLQVINNNTYVTNKTVPINTIREQIDSLFYDFTASVDSSEVADIDVEELAGKLLPLINKKIELEKNEEKKQARIVQIRQLMQHPGGTVDTVKVNHIPTSLIYKKVARRAEVFGFHPSWMNKFYLNYNYKLLTTLVYYGYELDGKTGGYKSKNGWDTAKVVTKAKKAGCKVVLCIYDKDIKDLKTFLDAPDAQLTFINEACRLLKLREADGINILFENFGEGKTDKFTRFIGLLHQRLKAENAAYQLSVTLPAFDKDNNYDTEALNNVTDHFIIDFSRVNKYGPITPVKGTQYSLEAGIDGYVKNIPLKKIIGCLTYNGVIWNYKTKRYSYSAYNKIIDKYAKYKPVYDSNAGIRIDVISKKDTLKQVWYDNAETIAEKYDYILSKDVAGIGIWGLGYDDGRPELWNVLMDKTLYIETSKKAIKPPVPVEEVAAWRTRLQQEVLLYKKLFNHPCSFNRKDKNDMLSDNLIIIITEILFVIVASIAIFCLMQKKKYGEDWERRKIFYGVLMFLSVLLAFCIMLCLFLNPGFAGFGLSAGRKCETSFSTLLKILAGGILIGLISMKFLVLPLVKPKEIP